MPHDPKPSDNLRKEIREIVSGSMDPGTRRALTELKVELAHTIQRLDPPPDVAITAMMNVMASIIGTEMTPEDRALWTQRVLEYLPAYVEAYRVREKKL